MTPGDQDGEGIRRLRDELGLTQRQFADKIKVDRASLANIERGNKAASLDMLLKIADGLGTDLLAIVRPGTSLHLALTRDGGNGDGAA